MNTFPSKFKFSQKQADEFLSLLRKERHSDKAEPEWTMVRTRLTDRIETYLGPNEGFQVFIGSHLYYPVHVDIHHEGRMVAGRFNVLLTGEPGSMQWYQTDEDYTQDRWRQNIQSIDYSKLEPIDRQQCNYPAFVRTDILHDVHFDSCHKGKSRVMLSYPFYNHSWEQIVERFKL